MKNSDQTTTQKGKEAENFACEFLEGKGFTIVERNFYTRFGELDIVAKRGGILHFVEVKSGVGFAPIYNLNATKMQRLQKSISVYLKAKHTKSAYCLSALILTKQTQDDKFSIEWLENITIF